MSSAKEPSPKVVAAATGGGTGFALSLVLTWILSSNGVDVPDSVALAIGSLISTALAAVGGWLKRDRLRDVGAAVVDGAEGA